MVWGPRGVASPVDAHKRARMSCQRRQNVLPDMLQVFQVCARRPQPRDDRTHTSDRFWYANEVAQFEEEEEQKKKEQEVERRRKKKSTINLAWGKEKMISKSGLKDPEAGAQVKVKDSDENEKMKEKKWFKRTLFHKSSTRSKKKERRRLEAFQS